MLERLKRHAIYCYKKARYTLSTYKTVNGFTDLIIISFLFLVGNNIGRDERSKATTTTNSGSSKRSRMSSTATTTTAGISGNQQPNKNTQRGAFANKDGSTNSNPNRSSTENQLAPKPSASTTTGIVHEKLPNGVCSCGATGPFGPPLPNSLGQAGNPNQVNAPVPRNMAPPAAHSNQRTQAILQHGQHQQRQPHQTHLNHPNQQQLMHQQWAMSAHQRQRWSSSMVCCPPPLPAPPPPISGQPTFPTSHYWNELVPTTVSTTSSNSSTSSFQAAQPQCRQASSTSSASSSSSGSSSKRSLRSQQQNQADVAQQYPQNGNQNVTPSETNGWVIGGPNYYQQQKQQHWLQQRYLQHQQSYHNLHQNHQQLQHQSHHGNIPLVPHLLHHTQTSHPPSLPPNNNNSLCRGCAEGKCPLAALPSSSGSSSSLVALQRHSAMLQMQASSSSSSKPSF